jgi:hypothetical protein
MHSVILLPSLIKQKAENGILIWVFDFNLLIDIDSAFLTWENCWEIWYLKDGTAGKEEEEEMTDLNLNPTCSAWP